MTRRNVAIALAGCAVVALAVFTVILLNNTPEGAGGGVSPTGDPADISRYWESNRSNESKFPDIIRT